MFTGLHRRYDRIAEPWRELLLLGVVLAIMLAVAQPWSPPLALGGLAAAWGMAWSRLRYLEGD